MLTSPSQAGCLDIRLASRRRGALVYVLITVAWTVPAMWVVWQARDAINPDAIAYVRNGSHYLAGRWDLAVNGWFGPAFSWLAAMALAIRAEPMLTLRASALVFAPLSAMAGATLTKSIAPNPWPAIVYAMVLALTLGAVGDDISPDLMLSAGLGWYLVVAQKVIASPSTLRVFACALLGGACYMIKGYALPFVAAHLVLTLCWVYQRVGRRVLAMFCAGVAGLLISAGPWVLIVSLQAGEPTISTIGRSSHMWRPVRPKGVSRVYSLQIPRDGRYSTWENPAETTAPWPQWSDGDGERVRRVIVVWGLNVWEALVELYHLDMLGIITATWIGGIALAYVNRSTGRMGGWLACSSLLYLAGLTLLWVYERFLIPIYAPMLAASAWVGGMARPVLRARVAYGIAGVVMCAVCLVQALRLGNNGTLHRRWERGTQIRRSAMDPAINTTFASNEWLEGLCLGYWSGGRFAGRVRDASALRGHPSCTMLVIEDEELVRRLERSPEWRLRAHDEHGMWTLFDQAR